MNDKILNPGNWQGTVDRWTKSDIPGVAPPCVKTLVSELAGCFFHALRYVGSWVQKVTAQGLWEAVSLGETSM